MRKVFYKGEYFTIRELADKFNDSFENFRKRLYRYDFDVELAVLAKNNGLRTKKPTVQRAKRTTHGLSGTKTYKVWEMIIQRCTNPNNSKYASYGGRGIKVCDKWKKFEGFLEDVGIIPDKMQIDRINNDGDYTPDNCRLCTQSINMQNTRKSRFWVVDGIKYSSMKEAAEVYEVNVSTIANWCKGRTIYDSGKKYYYPPKDNCYSELKYNQEVCHG